MLIDKEKHKKCLELSGEARWNYIFHSVSKVKHCGDETSNGCGCCQPKKIVKEGLATVMASWEDEVKAVMKLLPEHVISIFKRISDEDVDFMGFSHVWSRPEWMICTVFPIPPPSVRPSVRQDNNQRSEDDLTFALGQIIKNNKFNF